MTNVAGHTALFLGVVFDHLDVVLALLASHRTGVDLAVPCLKSQI